jgi:hypothetical protein
MQSSAEPYDDVFCRDDLGYFWTRVGGSCRRSEAQSQFHLATNADQMAEPPMLPPTINRYGRPEHEQSHQVQDFVDSSSMHRTQPPEDLGAVKVGVGSRILIRDTDSTHEVRIACEAPELKRREATNRKPAGSPSSMFGSEIDSNGEAAVPNTLDSKSARKNGYEDNPPTHGGNHPGTRHRPPR